MAPGSSVARTRAESPKCRGAQLGWDVSDFSKNSFSPAEFESTVRSALEVSDGYVWIYSERPKWWTNEKLPKEYVEALTKARKAGKKE